MYKGYIIEVADLQSALDEINAEGFHLLYCRFSADWTDSRATETKYPPITIRGDG